MTEHRDTKTDPELERFFTAARHDPPAPSGDFLARLQADMTNAQPTPSPAPRRRRALGGLVASLGGWPALAGLATATLAGLWIGYSDPQLALWPDTIASDDYDLGALLPGYVPQDDWSL